MLCLVVLISGARAPSMTPFLAAGAGAAGAGSAGAVLQLTKRRLRLPSAARVALVLVTALLVALPAGGLKYSYGSTGSAAIALTLLSPTTIDWESSSALSGEVSLYNDGDTTLRVRPVFDVRVSDPSGLVLLRYAGNRCPIALPGPSAERDLVEIAPGALLRWSFTLPVAWSGQPSQDTPCGAVVIAARGAHSVVGLFSSAPFNAFALVPVWDASLASEPTVVNVV